nr:retrotransposon protein putative Ty1-copia subclass [Tanacetum cinerariifolium]
MEDHLKLMTKLSKIRDNEMIMISKMRDKINPRKKMLNPEEAKGQEPRNCLDLILFLYGYKWIFKKKMKADGTIDKYKVRLVIKGFRQRKRLDLFDTYLTVTRITSIRMVLAIAALRKIEVHQKDIKVTFLNGDLENVKYMNQPEGFMTLGLESKVCRKTRLLNPSGNMLSFKVSQLQTMYEVPFTDVTSVETIEENYVEVMFHIDNIIGAKVVIRVDPSPHRHKRVYISCGARIPANKHIRHVRYDWVKNVSNEYWPIAGGHLNSETDLLQTDTLQLLILRLAYGTKAERYPLRNLLPGLSYAIQSMPMGNSDLIGGGGPTCALTEVPVITGNNGNNVSNP